VEAQDGDVFKNQQEADIWADFVLGKTATQQPRAVVVTESDDEVSDFMRRHPIRRYMNEPGHYVMARDDKTYLKARESAGRFEWSWVDDPRRATLLDQQTAHDWLDIVKFQKAAKVVLAMEAQEPDEAEVDAAISAYRESPDTGMYGIHRGDRVLFAYGGLRSDPPEARQWRPGTVVNVSSNKALVWVHPDDEEPDVAYYKEASELKKLRESEEEQDDPEALLPTYTPHLLREYTMNQVHDIVAVMPEYDQWDDAYFDFEKIVVVGRLPNSEVGGDHYGWRITLEASGMDDADSPVGKWQIWGGAMANTEADGWNENAPIPDEHMPAITADIQRFLKELFARLPGLKVQPHRTSWSAIGQHLPPNVRRPQAESTEAEQDDPEGLLSDYAPKLASAMGRELVDKYGLTNLGAKSVVSFDGYSANVNQHVVEFTFTMRVPSKAEAMKTSDEIEAYFRTKFKGGWSMFVTQRPSGNWEAAVWIPRKRLRVDAPNLQMKGIIGPPQPA
jgi:hypothetical protein